MKLAQTIKLNAIDAALLSAVAPIEALPRSARAPLSFAQQRLVIGTLNANRSRPEIEGLISCLVHSFAVRIVLSGDPTLETLLGQVNIARTRT
ncbi:hypothetical protein [Mesorhizobium sp. M0478]|uniref:hypothetical protein n=1 Tax=Mesorhizobium sp. M0478 TaxID=2956947 RepID=UPI00333547E7